MMSRLVREARRAEAEAKQSAQHQHSTESSPPGLCAEFNTTRLFLSHFGFLNKLVNNCFCYPFFTTANVFVTYWEGNFLEKLLFHSY